MPTTGRIMLVPLIRIWRRMRRDNLRTGPSPADVPIHRVPAPDSGAHDRVLLFGSGPAVGWGVLSHDLALTGHLSRTLAAQTGHGVEVVAIAGPEYSVTSAPRRLNAIDLTGYDLIVLTFGVAEAQALMSLATWKRRLELLLHTATAAAPPPAHLVVAGVPSLLAVPGYGSRLGRLAHQHAERLNAVSAAVCATVPRTTFVALSATPESVHGRGYSEVYRLWAADLAVTMVPLLRR